MPPADDARTVVAGVVRRRCVEILIAAWEDASIQGLCGEGALEYAVDRLRHMPVEDLLDAETEEPMDSHKQGDSK